MKEQEEFQVWRAETFCYALRDAIVGANLKYPQIKSFELSFDGINDNDSLNYLLGLLHECWCLVHITYLFDTPKKSYLHKDMSQLNFTVKEDLNKKLSILVLEYADAWYKRPKLVQMHFEDYLHTLFETIQRVCQKKQIDINDKFLVDDYISVDVSARKLNEIFTIIATRLKCCDNTSENRQIFLSMFDTTVSNVNGSIEWLDIGSEKGREPSIASLYTIFSTLGVDMNIKNKIKISNHFHYQKGRILPDKIKARANNKQDKVKKVIEDVLNAPDPI